MQLSFLGDWNYAFIELMVSVLSFTTVHFQLKQWIKNQAHLVKIIIMNIIPLMLH
jgi:hypothetical protein